MIERPKKSANFAGLLSDEEFARLMIAEYEELRQQKGFFILRRPKVRWNVALWASALVFFISMPVIHVPTLEDEFASLSPSDFEAFAIEGARAKGGGASVSPLPKIEADFNLSDEIDNLGVKQKVLSLRIRSERISNLRIDIYENKSLRIIRKLDKLTLPIEQFQQVAVNGQVWGFTFTEKIQTLLCIKPSNSAFPPERLNITEMQMRAEKFPKQCFYWGENNNE